MHAAPESLNREAAVTYFHKLTSMLERNYTQECMRKDHNIKPEISARQHLEGYHNWIRNNMQFNSHDSLKFFDDKLAGTAAGSLVYYMLGDMMNQKSMIFHL